MTRLKILKKLNAIPLTAKLLAFYDEPVNYRFDEFLAELYEYGGETGPDYAGKASCAI